MGGAVARVASAGTQALGYFLWYLLRLLYRGEAKLVAMFAGVFVAMGVTAWVVAS